MQEPGDIDKLDLGKYGLAYLEGENLLALEGEDMDKLLEALGNDDISLIVPLPATPEIIGEILAASECRRCGWCCIPNPHYPDSPGVQFFKEEIREICGYLQASEETLNRMSTEGQIVPYPFQSGRLSFTRWMPLACPFYIEKGSGCRIYPVRPVVCKVHPVIFTGDDDYFAIKLRCDYGKDIVKYAFKKVLSYDSMLKIPL